MITCMHVFYWSVDIGKKTYALINCHIGFNNFIFIRNQNVGTLGNLILRKTSGVLEGIRRLLCSDRLLLLWILMSYFNCYVYSNYISYLTTELCQTDLID
jgi:hypothetical protein